MAGPSAPPALTWQGIKKESFQKGLEGWFMKGNALWPWLVRANNQISYTFFNQISGTYNTTIVAGREGHFLQPMYFNSFNRLKTPPRKGLEKRVARSSGCRGCSRRAAWR
jgi:hypothetical protein